MPVQMELSRVLVSDLADQHVIFLKETHGEREFPIVIGPFEAAIINRRLLEEPPQRPLTHDLLRSVIEKLGGEAIDVTVTDLRDHTYYAVLRIRQGDQEIEIDCRPSDAIALSLHFDPPLPVFVSEHVLEAVGIDSPEDD